MGNREYPQKLTVWSAYITNIRLVNTNRRFKTDRVSPSHYWCLNINTFRKEGLVSQISLPDSTTQTRTFSWRTLPSQTGIVSDKTKRWTMGGASFFWKLPPLFGQVWRTVTTRSHQSYSLTKIHLWNHHTIYFPTKHRRSTLAVFHVIIVARWIEDFKRYWVIRTVTKSRNHLWKSLSRRIIAYNLVHCAKC